MALKIGKLFSLGGGDDGGSQLDLTSADGRVKALISEIRAAQQQRRITATCGDAELIMDAGGKQLFRIISVKPETLRFAKATGIESRSYDNLDNQLIIITQLLAEFSGLPGAFDMVSRPVPTPYPAKLEGFSPDELSFAYSRYAPAEGGTAIPGDKPVPEATAPKVEPAAAPAPTPAAAPVEQRASATPPPAPPPATAPANSASAEKRQVATTNLKPGTDTAFHDLLAGYCDFTMLINSSGEILIYTDGVPEWPALASDIAPDMLRWVKNTASVLPPKQLVVMRSQLSQSQSICFYLDGDLITFAVISSVAIGRLFVAANEYVG